MSRYMDDIIYGLRNLSVMDDEQTRIDGMVKYVPYDAQQLVYSLIRLSRYEQAYKVAIMAWARNTTFEKIVAATRPWVNEFYDEPYAEEETEAEFDERRTDLVKDITETARELIW